MSDRSTPVSEQPVAEELAALRRELATVHARLDRATRRPARRRRLARLLPLGIAALLVALVPLSALAVNPFTDLTGGPHDNNIDAIFNAGITTGCSPTEYCPTANVTRQEMASFLARTAGLGANKPVANAARLATTNPTAGGTTYAANDLVRVARASSTAVFPANFAPTAVYPSFEVLPGAALTIQAPGSGFVLVSATVESNVTATTEAGVIQLRDATAGAPASAVSPFVYSGFSTANAYNAMSATWVFPVSGAGAKTFQLEVSQNNPTANDSRYWNGALTALFVPFGSGGASTLEGPDPVAPGSGPLQRP